MQRRIIHLLVFFPLLFRANWTPGLASRQLVSTNPPWSNVLFADSSSSSVEFATQLGGSVDSVAVQGDYAFLGLGQRLVVVKFSSQGAPSLYGQTEILTGLVEDVAVDDHYAYLAEWGNFGAANFSGAMRVVNISNPAAPHPVGLLLMASIPSQIALFGHFVYLISEKTLYILDVSNPEAPVQVTALVTIGCANTLTLDAAMTPGAEHVYLYLAEESCYPYNMSGLEILDITDPANPKQSGFYDMQRHLIFGATVANQRAYLPCGSNLQVLDVSDPSNPLLMGQSDPTNNVYGPVALAGNFVITNEIGKGLHFFDLASLTHPVETGIYTTAGDVDDILVVAGRAYLAEGGAGLEVLDVGNPQSPSQIGHYREGGFYDEVFISDHYAYASGTDLRIFDILDPTHPVQVGAIPVAGKISTIASGVAYLTQFPTWIGDIETGGGVYLVDVSNPKTPVLIGFFDTPGRPDEVAVDGQHAFVADRGSGLRVLDVSNPASITEVGFLATVDGEARGIALGNLSTQPGKRFAYVADFFEGLQIVDVTDPAHPVEVGRYSSGIGYQVTKARTAGDDVYIGESGAILKLDVTDPSHPVAVWWSNPSIQRDSTADLEISGDYVYAAQSEKGLAILDKKGVIAGSYLQPPFTDGLAVAGNFVYLAAGRSGLIATWFGPSTYTSIQSSGGSLTSAFDRTSYNFNVGTFPQATTVWHHPRYPANTPPAPGLLGSGHFFTLEAWLNGQLIEPTILYTVTIQYMDNEINSIVEGTLGLYFWNGVQWVPEPTSRLDIDSNTVTATPAHFSLWGVLGKPKEPEVRTQRIFFPSVWR